MNSDALLSAKEGAQRYANIDGLPCAVVKDLSPFTTVKERKRQPFYCWREFNQFDFLQSGDNDEVICVIEPNSNER